jgi:hypothetical protein
MRDDSNGEVVIPWLITLVVLAIMVVYWVSGGC